MGIKVKHSKLGLGIIEGLQSYLDYRDGKKTLKTTERESPEPAPLFTSNDIQKLRKDIFHVSQPLFARILNVESPTIRAWEQGTRHPSGTALRLLEILAKDPTIVKKITSNNAA